MEKLKYSWGTVIEQTKELAEKIKKDRFKPDIIIGMIRGGIIPTRLLSTYLECDNIYCLRAHYYSKDNHRTRNVRIIHGLNVDLTDKRVLLVDEIADSGHTLRLIKKYIQFFNPKEIRSAVLHMKKHTVEKPTYFVEEINTWAEYPWE